MGKDNANNNLQNTDLQSVLNQNTEIMKAEDDKKVVKVNRSNKPNIFKRMGKWFSKHFKEMGSELKKVTWPSFMTVLKGTGTVLLVVFSFLIVISLFDLGLSSLLGLLVK
jgi:preprotein translocase subunit SecE